MRFAVVQDFPSPYHTPVLNELNKLVDLHVIYMSRHHPLGNFKNTWGAAHEFDYSVYWSVPLRWRSIDFRAQVSLGVSARLQRFDPEAILFSSWGPMVLEPLLWKQYARRTAVMWAESTSFSGLLRGRVSNSIRRFILSQTDAFVTNGSAATDYLENLGVDPSRVVTACLPSTVGAKSFASESAGERCPCAEAGPHFLFVGRLVALKRPLELLDCFATVLSEFPRAKLTLVGDGLLLPEVRRASERFGESVELLGRVEGEDLDRIYAAADIFVFPSVRDVWGLVINEALANGLYVITTDGVGAAFDLIDQTSGSMVPADDFELFTEAMRHAARTVRRDASGKASRAARVAGCTPAAFARAILDAARLDSRVAA